MLEARVTGQIFCERDPDATLEICPFRAASLAEGLADETSRFAVPDLHQIAAALPTPSNAFTPLALHTGTHHAHASASAGAWLRLGAYGLVLVLGALGAIALGGALLP